MLIVLSTQFSDRIFTERILYFIKTKYKFYRSIDSLFILIKKFSYCIGERS